MAAPDGGPRGGSGPAPQAARRAGRSLLRPGRCGRDAPYGTAPPPRFLRQTEAGGGRPPKVTCVSSEVGTCTRPRSLSAPRAGPVCPHPCGVLPLESPLGLSGSVSLSVSPPQGGHSARAPRWRAEADPAAGRRGRWRKRRLRIYRLRLCVCFSDSGSVRNRRDRQRPPHSAPALWSRGGRGGGPQGCRTHSLAGAEPAIGDSLLGLPRPPQPHRQSLLAPGGTLIGKARSRWHKRDRGSRRWPRGPLRAGARLAP